MHDNETGLITFKDLASTEQAESLKGTYTTQELRQLKMHPELANLLHNWFESKTVSTALQQLDQRNVTVTVTVATEG